MSRALYELLQASYGIKTTIQESVVGFQVAITVTKVVSYNPNRLGLTIINNGAATIYITPNNKPTVGRGIRLLPAGGSVSFKWDTDFELVASEFHAIADGAASDVYYLEITAM